MQNSTIKTLSAEDGFLFVININIAQYIWTSVVHYSLSSEKSCRVEIQTRTVATSDMHKYSRKIQYRKNLTGIKLEGEKVSLGGKGRNLNAGKYLLELLEGLIIFAGLGGVSEGLAEVAVRPLVGRVASVGGVGHRVGALGLGGAVLRVVEVKAVADIAEQTRSRLLFPL